MSSPPGKKTCVLLSILCRKVNSHRCNLLFDSQTTLHLQCGHLMTVVVKKKQKKNVVCQCQYGGIDGQSLFVPFVCPALTCYNLQHLCPLTLYCQISAIFFAISCECVITKYSRWQILPSNSEQGMFF